MEEFNKNVVRDSHIHVEGDFYMGDTYNAPEDEPFKCFNCETPLGDARNQRTELGIVCHVCGELNFHRPASRTAIGGKFQNMKPEHEQDYAFLINEIEVNLAKRSQKANEDALSLAQKAIEMNLRTPDAYLFKALCLYYLSKPRWKLVQNNAEEVLSPIGTARRINDQYKLLQIISGVIAGRYFQYLKFTVERQIAMLYKQRLDYDVKFSENFSNLASINRQIDETERSLISIIQQFAICYDIYPNPLFLRTELAYLTGNAKEINPIVGVRVEGVAELKMDDVQSLRTCLASLDNGQYNIWFGNEPIEADIQRKIERLQQIDRNWKAPVIRFNLPLELGQTIDEIKSNVKSRIAELERQAELERLRLEEERKSQLAKDKKAQEIQQFYAILTVAGAIICAWLAAWLIGMAYTEISDNSYSIGQTFVALLKIPIAFAALAVGIVLFIVFWLLEAISGLLGWQWNWSSSVIDWAWNDVFNRWLWEPTNGIYLFAGAVMLYILYRMFKLAAQKWR